jgi:hypothetical protein
MDILNQIAVKKSLLHKVGWFKQFEVELVNRLSQKLKLWIISYYLLIITNIYKL